ncbi:MAG TPA: TonB-dependent receptor, partial [Candidatus Acidoferrales bacterium]|nr:TonB-dependent receptor [Candidatus Acidoferrales bacterium]
DDGRAMLAISDAIGDDRSRVIYGVDLTAGNARVDGGTGSACTSYAHCGEAAYQDQIAQDAYAQTAVYAQGQWFWRNGGEIYAGLRGERDLNQLATAEGAALSPSAGGIVPIGAQLQLKLNAATAFRAPDAEELFYPPEGVFSNPALVPERTRVADATLVDTGPLGNASLGWFSTWGSNLIVDANPAEYDFEPQNVGRAIVAGVTLALDTKPRAGFVETVSVTNLYRAEDLDTGTRIVGRGPVFASTFGVRYEAQPASRFDGFGITLASDGLAEPADFALPAYAQASDFTTLDAYVAYRVRPDLALVLRGYNMLDDRYAVFNGYPMPGPSFGLELRAR